ELRLDDLLPDRVLVAAEVGIANQLHRDRRSPLQSGAVGDVLDGRAEDPGEVDAVVLVEPLILDRDGRVLELGGDLLPGDRCAQLVGLDEAEARAVGGEHLRGAVAENRAKGGDRGSRLGDVQDVSDRRDRADDQGGDEDSAADQDDSCRGAAVVPAPALSCLSRHLRGLRDYRSDCDFLPLAPWRPLRSVPQTMNSDTAELAIVDSAGEHLGPLAPPPGARQPSARPPASTVRAPGWWARLR